MNSICSGVNTSFFSSYNRADSGWSYIMGNFAQMSLPLADAATLTVVRVNHTFPETFTVRNLCYAHQHRSTLRSCRTARASARVRCRGPTLRPSERTTA